MKYFRAGARLDCRSRESWKSGLVHAFDAEEKQVDGADAAMGDEARADDTAEGDYGGGGTRSNSTMV